MGDYTVIVAALAGAAAGVLLLRWANSRDRRAAADQAPPPAEPATPTGYARRPVRTAAPILLAVGLALLGVGLAIGSGDGRLDVRPLLPGVVVLLAALVAVLRQASQAGPPAGHVPGDDVIAAEGVPGEQVAAAAERQPPRPD
jgi:peptidoglycan/LPS O-acetylase OafA/YrhL